MRLAGKTIVIVGGSTGLGLSAAAACHREGAQLMIVGRDEANCRRAVDTVGSDNAIWIAGDARDAATAPRAIEEAVRQFGSFDALYHVAGGSGRSHGDGPLHELSDAGWSFTVEQNLSSVAHSNRAAAAYWMAAGRGGAVLNMGSVLAAHPSSEHFATHAYAAAKAGIVGLTKAAAAYYASHDIRFNVIAPALVETPMSKRATADVDIVAAVRRKQPLDGGRVGRPTDLDGAVVHLLSDESGFTTGQVFNIDGGWSVSG
ncbi:MAG: SDR family oxidoreductase [Pirellulaceae bacterium]|jgi:NAD(P)-dependent dehydrogenase (short-subunit alcohol dehydrogenase family)|nr:SDR family oxidoreductase [Pirellulaceae bacterium]MDP7017355.1 SDR family oxidoreductase [Pirellulaceae bacterium]